MKKKKINKTRELEKTPLINSSDENLGWADQYPIKQLSKPIDDDGWGPI